MLEFLPAALKGLLVFAFAMLTVLAVAFWMGGLKANMAAYRDPATFFKASQNRLPTASEAKVARFVYGVMLVLLTTGFMVTTAFCMYLLGRGF